MFQIREIPSCSITRERFNNGAQQPRRAATLASLIARVLMDDSQEHAERLFATALSLTRSERDAFLSEACRNFPGQVCDRMTMYRYR